LNKLTPAAKKDNKYWSTISETYFCVKNPDKLG